MYTCVCMVATDIIRKFNPKVKGFSTGATLIAQEDAGLNVAVGGHQARYSYIRYIIYIICIIYII